MPFLNSLLWTPDLLTLYSLFSSQTIGVRQQVTRNCISMDRFVCSEVATHLWLPPLRHRSAEEHKDSVGYPLLCADCCRFGLIIVETVVGRCGSLAGAITAATFHIR